MNRPSRGIAPLSARMIRVLRLEHYMPQFPASDHAKIEQAHSDRDEAELGRVFMAILDKVFQRRESNERPLGIERRSSTRSERRRNKR